MAFIDEDFMLHNDVARRLYHTVAKPLPIIDYHCHLDPRAIAENKPFTSITELWLAGDHYKWRAMRANGVPEEKITGNAPDIEKFQAWAETVEACVGNPLHHWTHLELKYYFNITETLNCHNWRRIWEECNAQLHRPEFTPRGLIEKSNVKVLCTTDAPTDTLEYHHEIQRDPTFHTLVLPTFRPDEALEGQGEGFERFIKQLELLTGISIQSFSDFIDALEQRVEHFHQHGGRISDHGLTTLEYLPSSTVELESLFTRKCQGQILSEEDEVRYRSAVLVELASIYTRRSWTMQIHFGVLRNNNSTQFKALGVNTGYDSINDQPRVGLHINRMLDAMAQRNGLPKIIIYNLDPGCNDVVASALANFQSAGSVKSPMQFGSGWWLNDTQRGMVRQLTTLADHGLLTNFVGMLTDSRSFISYTRHEYFRRILCQLIGQWVMDGEIPNDSPLLENLIDNICYRNAERYFSFEYQ